MLQTRKRVFVALLAALSFILMLLNFPILPGADFLKLDFSILPILFGLLLFDLKTAYAILVLRSLLKILLDNGGPAGLIGLPMNIVAILVFVWVYAYFWEKDKACNRFWLAGLIGTVLSTLAMLVLNYVYALPVYAGLAGFDIEAIIGLKTYFVGMVLPFNLLQGVMFALVFGLLLAPTRRLIEENRRSYDC